MLQHETWPIDKLIEYARNPRKNDHAVDRVAAAIREFGFRVPVVAKSDGTVVDGHLRLKAAKKLGLTEVPVVLADDMTDLQIKAFRLSVNKMAELAEWDDELLALELGELHAADFDMALLGFDAGELSAAMGLDEELDGDAPKIDEGIDYKEKFAIIVECADEAEQRATFERLDGMGFTCKVLVN
jgi:ParB-like chromosome segregation protein Spo0J